MKKLLITGATGFVGGYIVEEAYKQNFEIYTTVRASSNKEYIEDFDPQYIQTNLLDTESIFTTLSEHNFDYVIHNAGITKAKSRDDYFKFNLRSVEAFTDAINRLKIKPKLTFISSLAACGPADDKDDGIIKPNSPCSPVTYYGESKLAAEEYIRSNALFEWSIIRPTAVYGPREKDLLALFQTINKGINARLGNNKKELTFIYVTDLAKLIISTTLQGKKEIYLAASKEHYTEEELAGFIKKSLGKKTVDFSIPMGIVSFIAVVNELYAKTFDKVTILNKNKLNELNALSWVCDTTSSEIISPNEVDLQMGIEQTVQWYKANNWL